MARPRGVPFRRTSSVRRQTSWGLGSSSASGGQTLSSSGTSIGGLTAVPTLEGQTIVRTRGEFVVNLLTSSAPNGGFHGAFGIAVVTQAALTVGVTAVPSPLDEEDWDGWLYHRYFHILSGGILDSSVVDDEDIINSTTAALRVEVDSKAMRKLPVEEAVFCAVQVVEIGVATGLWQFDSRMLMKLP